MTHEEGSKAKSFTVDAGKANIYLFKNQTDDGERGKVFVNATAIGTLESDTFFKWSIAPENYRITAEADDGTTSLSIETVAGNRYLRKKARRA